MAQRRGGDTQNKQGGEEGRANWSKEALLIFCDPCSEYVEKSKGKKGGTIIAKDVEDMQWLIHPIHFSPKLILFMTYIKKSKFK